MPGRPTVALALDAFAYELLERWGASGELPHLASLCRQGQVVRLVSEWPGIALLPWPSFVMDQDLRTHGSFYIKAWIAERGRIAYDHLIPSHAFWQPLTQAGLRCAIIDVPYAPAPAESGAPLVLSGWQNHDEAPRGSHPRQLWKELQARFGAPVLGKEQYGASSPSLLPALRTAALDAIRQFQQILIDILGRGQWDLLLAVHGAAHRAGHYLWDPAQLVPAGKLPPQTAAELADGLREVYRAVDQMVGAVRAAVPAHANLIVFALHGMGHATPWTERLPEILALMAPPKRARAGMMRTVLRRLRRSRLAFAVARRVPYALQELISRASMHYLYDWSQTRIFALPSEGIGALRVNLRGRERYGIVSPEDYHRVLEEVGEWLEGLRELATGEPLAERVVLVDQMVGASATARHRLPDLVVQWRQIPLSQCRGIVSRDGRVLDYGGPLATSSGRTGDHLPDGFAIVVGPDVKPGLRGATMSVRTLPSLLRQFVLGEATALDAAISPSGARLPH